jgi:hypothetical protein
MGVPHEARNISISRKAKEEFIAKEYDLLPVLEIGNTVITTYTGLPQVIEALVSEGYLT